MNNTTFNAAASASIDFYHIENEIFYSRAKNSESKAYSYDKSVLDVSFWKFDLVMHYTTLLHDEFGIQSLESRLEEMNIQEDDNLHMYVHTPELLDVLQNAIEQELEPEHDIFIFALGDEIVIIHHKDDKKKITQINDKGNDILARADYLGALDNIEFWTSKKPA